MTEPLSPQEPSPPAKPPPPPTPAKQEEKKKVETVLVGGKPVVFVRDPSLGCTAGVAACQTAIMEEGGCTLIKREASQAVGGLWGIVFGEAAGAVCDQEIQEVCTKVVCE